MMALCLQDQQVSAESDEGLAPEREPYLLLHILSKMQWFEGYDSHSPTPVGKSDRKRLTSLLVSY